MSLILQTTAGTSCAMVLFFTFPSSLCLAINHMIFDVSIIAIHIFTLITCCAVVT